MAHPVSGPARPRIGSRICHIGALAGLAGGAAEVVWVWLYGSVSSSEAAAVARGVTKTFSPHLAAGPLGAVSGIAMHMAIALTLGIGAAIAARAVLPRHRPALAEPLLIVAFLIGIWAVNFFVLLPIVNAAFVDLVPYGASFASKEFFGVVAGSVLVLAGERPIIRDYGKEAAHVE